MSEFVQYSVAIGIGATVVYDLWGRLLTLAFGLPGSNWTMAGRWFSHMAHGQFIHSDINAAAAIRGEAVVGWTMHYLTGIVYAAVLIAIWGLNWAHQPTPGPALIVGVVTIAAGWLIMSPAMGGGIASARQPNANMIRADQLSGHVMFGVGLYLAALATSKILQAS